MEIKTSNRYRNKMPEGCPIKIEDIPAYCYYVTESGDRGEYFVVDKSHPNKSYWGTTSIKEIPIETKFEDLLKYLKTNIKTVRGKNANFDYLKENGIILSEYMYYDKANKSNGELFRLGKSHPIQKPLGKIWRTSGSRQLTLHQKYGQLMEYIEKNT